METEYELLKFYVQGSASEPYRVSFWRKENDFKSACTCQAGKKGMYCKHRFELIEGDLTNLVSENYEDIGKIQILIKGTPLEKIFEEFNYLKHCEEVHYDFKKMISRNQNHTIELETVPNESDILELNLSFTKNGTECRLYSNNFKYLGSFSMTLPKVKKNFPSLVESENSTLLKPYYFLGLVSNLYTQNKLGIEKSNFYLENKNILKEFKEKIKLAMR